MAKRTTKNPSWSAQWCSDGCDDATVKPRGDWKHAGKFMPMLRIDAGMFIARLDDPACPVSWFREEAFKEKGKGYKDGAFKLAPSLDAFLASLVKMAKPSWELGPNDFEASWDEGYDPIWEDDSAAD